MSFRQDRLWVVGLCLGVVMLLAPMLLGWRGIFLDDFYETFSRLLFNARSIHSGSLPLWDNQTFAGGRINFIPNTTIWYWPLYPFYLLTPSGEVDAAYTLLIKAPLLLHWLVCALGAFALGRGVMRLSPCASAVLAAVYSLGAAMSYNILDPSTAYATAWLPVLLWGVVTFSRKPSARPLIAGAAAFAFIGPCGSDVRGVFSLASAAIYLSVLFLIHIIRGKGAAGGRILRSALLISAIGILLSAPYWTAMVETVEIYRDSSLLDMERSASEMFSLPLPYLMTLFVPDLFGTLTGFRGVDLGVSYLRDFSYLEGNITGGFWLMLLVLSGSVAGWKARKVRKDDTGVWWWTGMILFTFSLLLISGRYSAPYLWLSRVFPLFGLPYAVRWRILQHLGLALAAGVSAHWLGEAEWRISRRAALVFLLVVLAGALWLWLKPEVFTSGLIISRAWRLYRGWLFSSPVLYLALAVIGSVVLIKIRRGRQAILVSAVLLEAFLIAFAVIYYLSWGDSEEWVRYRHPTESRYWRLAASVHSPEIPATGPERTVFEFSLIDQVATTVGGEYLFGHCSKPLAPRLFNAVDALTSGYPYALRIQQPTAAFFPNMSVRAMVLEHGSLPDDITAGEERFAGLGNWRLNHLTRTLPRVYTQDTMVISSPEQAFKELMEGDLRQAAYIEDRDQLSVISDQNEFGPDHGLRITSYGSFEPGDEHRARFERLQQINPIRHVSIPDPTRMVIDVEINQPSLLITTDVFHSGWRVKINGLPSPTLQVNYLQRAVFLEEGQYRVEWFFRPTAVKLGLLLTGAGVLALGSLCLGLRFGKKNGKQS